MSIQTQRFTPLKAQHYKLATTQSELDEEMRRKMTLNAQQNNAAVQRQNASISSTSANANANRGLKREENATAEKQQGVVNGLAGRKADRLDSLDATNADNESYNRKQDALSLQRNQKQQGVVNGLANRRQDNNDYATGRMKIEDARNDAERSKQNTIRDKTIALGGLGSFIDRMTNEGNFDKTTGLIDISEMKDALPVLVNGYEWRGSPKVLTGKDGYVTFYDDEGAIKNNGNPVRIHRSSFDESAKFAEMYRMQNMGIEVGKGDSQAIKTARKDFEYNRKMADKSQDEYDKFILDNPPPEPLKEGASQADIAYYDAEVSIHNKFINKINDFDKKAEAFSKMDGRPKGKGLRLSQTVPNEVTEKKVKTESPTLNPTVPGKAKQGLNKALQGLAQKTGTNDIHQMMVDKASEFYPSHDLSGLTDKELSEILIKNGINEINGQQFAG